MSEPLSAETVAREAAEAAVTVVPLMGEWSLAFAGKSPPPRYYQHRETAEAEAAAWAREIEPLFLAALRRWQDALATPGGLGGERLAEMREGDRKVGPLEVAGYTHSVIRHRRELLAEVDRLDAILRLFDGPEYALYCTAFDAGRRAGAREQREADVEAALSARDRLPGGAMTIAGAAVLSAVEDAPLVAGEGRP